MIFGGAWLSAALLTWFVFSRTTSAKSEKMVQVLAAAQDLPAGSRLKKSDLKRIPIPEKDAPKLAAVNEANVIDRVLLHPLAAGETIVTSRLVSSGGADGISAMIQPGMRAVAVPINDASSAGGLIQPRSRVDVLFTRTGTMREALTSHIIQDVMVLSIGRITEAGDPKMATQAGSGSQQRAATLMVTPEQAAKLELAKNQGKVSLVLRNPLDRNPVVTASATAEALDPDIFAGAARAMKRSMAANVPNIRDDKVWSELTGNAPTAAPGSRGAQAAKKEPPKPRFVIDVYRGDKHVQEIFQ